MEIKGQEVLSLWDALCCSIHLSVRWRHCKIFHPTYDFLQTHLQKPEMFWVHEWRVSEETRLVISRLLRTFSTRRSMSKSGTGNDYLLHYLKSPMKSTFKCLCNQTPLWRLIMSKSLRISEDQDDRKKGTLSNQPWLLRVKPTVLLGRWVQQPIKDMTSLGTDFEMHARWQGSVEEPHVKCSSTPPTENLLKTKYRVKTWH